MDDQYWAEIAKEGKVFEAAGAADRVLLKTIPMPEDHFLLRNWGKAATYPEYRAKYGEPNEHGKIYAHWFTSQADLIAFKQEMIAFCKTLPDASLMYDSGHRCPNTVKHLTVAYATLSYRGKEYEVRKEYGYGYPGEVAIFDWEENNTCDDDRRLPLIEETYPGTVVAEDFDADCQLCFVTAFRVAYEQ